MAFPVTLLRWTAEAALGADLTANPSTWTTWTDITALVKAPSITIIRGRASEFSTAPPSRGTATMVNNDGRWAEQNPTGVWYGLIGLNTPLRYLIAPDVNTASDTFTRTTSSSWGAAVVGGAWTVVGTAADYSTTGSVARITHSSAGVRHYAVLPATLTMFDVTVRVRTGALATGAALSAGIVFRYVDVSNSLRYEVLFNTDQTISARAVIRAAGVDAAGASHVAAGLTHVANTFYRVRAQSTSADGKSFRLKVWLDGTTEPSTWTAYSTTSVTAVAGTMGLTSARETGNTNAAATIDFDDYSLVDGPVPRHGGYIEGLPRRWGDSSATVLNAPINALGISGRLQQGGVLASAIRRGVLTAGVTPKAYWPGEDKATATQIASGLPIGLPMRITPPFTLGAGLAAGSDPLMQPVAAAGRIVGSVVPYTGTDWQVMFLINIPTVPGAQQALMRWQTTGTYPTWQLVLTPGVGIDQISLRAYDNNLNELLGDVGTDFTGEPYGQQLWCEVTAQQVGGDIHWAYNIWGASGKVGTKVGATAGTVTEVSHGIGSGGGALGGTVLGHICVWDTISVSLGSFAQVGWSGETATARLLRLGSQEAVPITLVATPTYDVAVMGAPTSSTLLTQLREVETADQGILYDEVDGSIAYLPREARTNRTVALTLDVALGQVAWPTEVDNDPQQLVNDVTSSQPNGTQYRYFDSTSTRSVSKGYYSKPVAANLAYPQDLRQDAEFRVALGTVPEDRWTTLTISLTGNTSLIPAWLQCNIGSRIQIVNTSSLFTPDTVDLIIEGYQEEISSTDWRVTLYTSSARPWNAWIAETGTGNSSLPDSGSSTLAAGVTSSATSLSIATSDAADLWTTGVVAFDIGIAGERMTVTNISGASSPQTFTVTRHVNGVVKAQTALDPLGNPTKVTLWGASVLAL